MKFYVLLYQLKYKISFLPSHIDDAITYNIKKSVHLQPKTLNCCIKHAQTHTNVHTLSVTVTLAILASSFFLPFCKEVK